MELCNFSAIELSRLIHQRKVSAVEVVESALKRIGDVDGRPGSLDGGRKILRMTNMYMRFITLTSERARARAKEVDDQLGAGNDPGPLAGVPFTVKDIFCVKGTPSTAASRILASFISLTLPQR